MDSIRRLIREVPDFPRPGIRFRDITPLLQDAQAFAWVVNCFADRYRNQGISKIAGIESRGFIFSAALAYSLGCGLVLLRKPGRLPAATYSATYDLEYGKDSLHIHTDALSADEKVVIIDDLIATGGTAKAAVALVRRCGAKVHEMAALVELQALRGREALAGVPVHTLLTY